MGSLAAACLEDYAGACPEIIVKRVWNDDFVPMISPHIGEEPFAALLRTVLEAVEPSSVGDATLNALLRSAEVLLCRGLEGPAATVMNFLIGSVGNGDLGRLSSGISAVLESVEVWESSTVNSDLFFGRICDLIVASAPRLSTVPLVALIDQLSTVFLEHFVSSPVATESFLNAMGVLIGDSYECPRLVELQHRLRSAAVLVSAVTIGSGSVVRLLMLGIVPRWLVPLLSVEDVGVTAGELFTRAVELDGGASSLTGLTALFSWLTSDGVVANNLLAAAEPLSKLIVSEWEPRMLTEALLLVSHVLRLLATRGCYRPASQVKARVLSAFSIAHLDEWKPDADAASHHVKHITLTLAWLLEECEEVPVEIFTLLANAVTVADSNLEVGSAEFLRAVVVAASQQPQFAESRMLHSAIKLIGTIETFAEDWQAETLLTACCNFLGRGHLGAEECALLCDLVAAVLMMHPVGVAILMDVGVCLEGVAATRLTSTGSLHIPLRESCLQAACVVYELLQAHSATPKCIWLGAWAESETGGSPGAVAFCAMAGIRLPVDGLSSITFTVRCAYWSMTLSSGRSNLNENEISDLLAFGAEGVLMGESSTAVDTECAVTLLSTLLVFARQTRDCLAISLILACLLSEPPIGLPYSCLVLALVRYRPVWYRLDPDCLLGHLCIVADSLEQLPGDHRRRFGEALVKWASDLLSPRHVAAINESSRLPPVVAHAPRRHGKDWDTWVMTGMIHRACDLIMKKLI
ncbi:hypothetical protein Pmar_PMAR006867 [Perkinsus marinus ATCC 50983]|uniref:Uncharacterized protein n=1 Tax=Perkinsus marinus (strain ATCC 50983 / TXsc) TaxID=423536 RepID=C5K6Q1_PERM5|nr:hypothetical protein Pmar_PMAR006867 [Perkinsus marinus ATCC 50983]EER19971.1 hypothetical protein Pmar_PMAR006867 [Perkinsus marinus ATCC 50983]|eukprot:XP_002788175.1 hypothetical protein Pmar_PMAR006867 [Perkinsus marinus ATCC 50983]